MKVSVNWIKEYTAIDLNTDELVEKIGSQLGEVEAVSDLSEVYKGIYIVKVVECVPHPQADKLFICKIDDGGVASSVKRLNGGLVEVVCGAPNVRSGMLTVWLPPGIIIPSTRAHAPITLEAKDIRGVVSNGMLASSKELLISDNHDGIIEIAEGASIGQPFGQYFHLDDVIIDIENKMLTHRPDLFGQIGIAREVAGISGRSFKSPDWYLATRDLNLAKGSISLEVRNEVPDLSPRFMAQVVNGVTVKPSSAKIQSYLSRVGLRPINNIVDLTNYFMMLTAQPFHAYDYDKLKRLDNSNKATIVIRRPKDGEQLKLINGKTVKLDPSDILIASNTKPIGLGGVMGGGDTEVDQNTKNIVVECATFNMYAIRRTSMHHGLFSDAVTRFTKGQSPLQNDKLLAEMVHEIIQEAGGEAEAPIDVQGTLPKIPTLKITVDFIGSHLGLRLDSSEIAGLLKNVEFSVDTEGDELTITAPFWRTDIRIPEDIVEEVGRLYGYDNLELKLPQRTIEPGAKDPLLVFESELRDLLVRGGTNQVLSYNFVGEKLFSYVGQDAKLAYKLVNALNPDLEYYRMSLLPSLLEKVHPNIKAGFVEFGLFEINKVHIKDYQDQAEPTLPAEESRLALVLALDGRVPASSHIGAPYYLAKYYLEYLLYALGIDYKIRKFAVPSSSVDAQATTAFEPVRTGLIEIEGEIVGVVGEPTAQVKANLKLPKYVAMLELDVVKLLKHKRETRYSKLSSYPFIEQDVCFKLPDSISYQELHDLVAEELAKLATNTNIVFSALDIYKRDDDHSNKQITFRVRLSSYDKTLTTQEVNEIIAKLGAVAREKFRAEII